MTTAPDDLVRVGQAKKAGAGGPHFPVGTRVGGKRPLPPWRQVVRKGVILGGLIGGGFLIPPQKDDARKVDTAVDAERASFDVAEGYEVNLFAADPLLAKPTQINFDARGRLWVACSEAYPQVKPGEPANDKIVILDDLDGDGTADKAQVFVDGLLIPTGVEPGDGGAYVAQGTELLHFQDTDDDGQADARRVVLSGFGTEDTHHIIHTLRWGPDGGLYFNQSLYIHSHVETPWGVQRLAGGGIWRFQPDLQFLSIFARGWLNPWGHAFDRWGQSFVTDGAGGQGINHAIPGGAYASAVGVSKTLPGLNPGSPKFCGAEILSGRHLPDSVQGDILTNDFRANNVRRFKLGDQGSSFHADPQPDLIRTRYQAFRPIDIKMGPDGAIYVADWYNPIINHGEVDFRDPRRDHTRGRIWRVTAKGRPLVERPRLADATVPQLLDFLKAPEAWTRHFARRTLKERGVKTVADPLRDWVKNLDPADPEVDHHRLEALWTAETLGIVAPDLLDPVLTAPDPHARAAAVRVVEHWLGRLDDPFARLAARVIDADPRVRLEAVRALGHIPEARGAEIALRALDLPLDDTLDYALATTLRDTQAFWHGALADGTFHDGGDARKLVYALEAVGSKATLKPLIAAIRAGKVGAAEIDRARALIANLGGPEELALIFDLALDPALPGSQRSGLLAALLDAATRRDVRPAGDLARLGKWLDPADPSTQAAAVRLAGAWKFEPLRDRVEDLANDRLTPRPILRAALDALVAFGGQRSVEALEEVSQGRNGLSQGAKLAAASATARLDLKRGALLTALGLGQLSPATPDADADLVATFEAFTTRAGGLDALAEALAGVTLDPKLAETTVRIATRLGGGTGSKLTEALSRAGGLVGSTGPKTWTPAERVAIVAAVPRQGDPARGEAIFRRAKLQCLGCHAIAGAGGRVGPGLESLGASAPVDYLVDSLVEPSKAIKEGFHAVTVATTDGRVVTGIKVGETDQALILRDAEDREIQLPLTSIDEQTASGSLMPAGLVDGLSRAELVDLVRFLSELGKLGPFAVSPQIRVARRWEISTGTRDLLSGSGPLDTVATDPAVPWSPAYATVAGTLPLAGGFSLARTDVEATTPGPVRLAITPAPAAVWLDGKRLEENLAERDVSLTTGSHQVTLATDAPTIRLELRDVPGSLAQARPVQGK